MLIRPALAAGGMGGFLRRGLEVYGEREENRSVVSLFGR